MDKRGVISGGAKEERYNPLAVNRAEVSVPVVEQDRGTSGGDLASQCRDTRAGHHPRLSTQEIENLQAEGLAGFAFCRADVKVGSVLKVRATPGMKNPESKDRALVIGAGKVLTDEVGYTIKHFRTGGIDG